MSLHSCNTALLSVAYDEAGPQDGKPLLLLHRWPDDATTWYAVASKCSRAGYRTISPWLRGFGATHFLSPATMRSGEMLAMAQDVLDFVSALGIGHFAVVGHDWGARIAYILAALWPERVTHCAALSVGWAPGELQTPLLDQARAFWYQWFMTTDRGARFVREQGIAFARYQWQTWSPPGWFDEATFQRTAQSFANPDWAEITLHAFRVRWGEAAPDTRYARLRERYSATRSIGVATLAIHGSDDRCVLTSNFAQSQQYFTGVYHHRLLEGIGHFPTREAAMQVSDLVLQFLHEHPG